MTPLVFLDVDGVLAHSGTIGLGRTTGESWGSSFYHAAVVCPLALVQFRRILDATGARFVLSSTWRKSEHQRTGLRRALVTSGLSVRETRALWIGDTPSTNFSDRSSEIAAWLGAHPESDPGPGGTLVLDDSEVPGPWLQVDPRPQFFAGGLLAAHADNAIMLLTQGPTT